MKSIFFLFVLSSFLFAQPVLFAQTEWYSGGLHLPSPNPDNPGEDILLKIEYDSEGVAIITRSSQPAGGLGYRLIYYGPSNSWDYSDNMLTLRDNRDWDFWVVSFDDYQKVKASNTIKSICSCNREKLNIDCELSISMSWGMYLLDVMCPQKVCSQCDLIQFEMDGYRFTGSILVIKAKDVILQ
jgi:hypothetical protein